MVQKSIVCSVGVKMCEVDEELSLTVLPQLIVAFNAPYLLDAVATAFQRHTGGIFSMIQEGEVPELVAQLPSSIPFDRNQLGIVGLEIIAAASSPIDSPMSAARTRSSFRGNMKSSYILYRILCLTFWKVNA